MELRKVLEIYRYKGDMWYIHPYISDGNIVRNTVFKVSKNKHPKGWRLFTFDIYWGKGTYFTYKEEEDLTEESEINTDVRVFTTRDEAKKALAEFEKMHAYRISESVDKSIDALEKEKAKIDMQIEKLKETKERAFKNISTCFIKKT